MGMQASRKACPWRNSWEARPAHGALTDAPPSALRPPPPSPPSHAFPLGQLLQPSSRRCPASTCCLTGRGRVACRWVGRTASRLPSCLPSRAPGLNQPGSAVREPLVRCTPALPRPSLGLSWPSPSQPPVPRTARVPPSRPLPVPGSGVAQRGRGAPTAPAAAAAVQRSAGRDASRRRAHDAGGPCLGHHAARRAQRAPRGRALWAHDRPPVG